MDKLEVEGLGGFETQSSLESESEAIRILSSLLAEGNEKTGTKAGACMYVAGGKPHCASLTQTQCNALKGTWYSDKTCKSGTDPLGPKECRAQ